MQTILTIARFEITALLRKRAFWLFTVLFPALVLLLSLGSQLLIGPLAEEEMLSFLGVAGEGERQAPLGYVDRAGLIEVIPAPVLPEQLRAYPDEEAAAAALAAGEIDQYYVVPADYVASGNLILIQRTFAPLGNTGDEIFQYILNHNLAANAAWAFLLLDPVPEVTHHPLVEKAPAVAGSDPILSLLVPLAVMMLLFFVLVMSSSYMLQSVSREKENRTVEILLLSVRPRQLMLGKILGLSGVALVQTAIWGGSGLLLAGGGGEQLQIVDSLDLPPAFLAWTLAYVLLGYLLYASLMGAVGALAPNAREGNQFSFVVLLPLMVPLWMNGVIIEAPAGPIAVGFSLFPLTAPLAMITRLAIITVPLWQIVGSLAGLAVTTYAAVLLAARFFRAGTLLSGAPIRWQRLFSAFRGIA